MPRTIGKDKSTTKRGQRKTTRAAYGVCGEWLCVSPKWSWDDYNFVRTYVLDDGEKLHMMFVFTWETDAVFEALGATWSFSKHLGARLLVDAVFLSPKIRIWNHGLVHPRAFAGKVVGFEAEHAERLPRVQAPWSSAVGIPNGAPRPETDVQPSEVVVTL